MAKWGEGDPRWIVEERPDGTNVNNWHWVEKNATGWSKEKLKELLVGMVIEDDEYFGELTELTNIDGEATANNRKAKLIFFYEWVLKGEWSGKLKSGDKKHKGKFNIPNLSEENDADEIDVEFSCNTQTDESYKVKEFLRKKGTKEIQNKLAKYIADLKQEYGKGVILPTKNGQPDAKKLSNSTNKAREELNKLVVTSPNKGSQVGVKINTKKLTGKQEFMCSAQDLYRSLTDKGMVQAFTGGPVDMEVEKGGRFSLMHGNVTGEFVDLVPGKKIVQRWRVKSWPDAHYSEVTFDFEEKEGVTELLLTQTGVPESEFERTKEGWIINYWNRIKQTFGYGTNIF